MKLTRKQLRKVIISEILDARALDVDVEKHAQILSWVSEELTKMNHPLPHVVINSLLMAIKNNPDKMPSWIANEFLIQAADQAEGEYSPTLTKGLKR